MSNPAITPTVDDVIDALASFLDALFPGAVIVRAQQNRVPMPTDPCIVLTELFQTPLQKPQERYDLGNPNASTVTLALPSRLDVQIDFYGPQAGDWCQTVQVAFRTLFAADSFPSGIAPLYTSDGVQSPLITGESQWESRWTLTVSMQYNNSVVMPQDYAVQAAPTVRPPIDLYGVIP